MTAWSTYTMSINEGDDGYTGSMQLNFPPSRAFAQVSLSQASGGGLIAVGISQYVTRRKADGADHYHNQSITFDSSGAVLTCYPPTAYDPLMTSVTATFTLGDGQDVTGTLVVTFAD